MTKAKMDQTVDLQAQLDKLVAQLEAAKAEGLKASEAEKRSKADYQNLVRRNQEDRAQLVKFASKALVSDMLQPLDHLSLAAAQLNDPGLNMVITQFWQKLNDHGLEAIDPVGQPFDLATMEAVDGGGKSELDDKPVVDKVVTKGYKLNGEVIQFARVILK